MRKIAVELGAATGQCSASRQRWRQTSRAGARASSGHLKNSLAGQPLALIAVYSAGNEKSAEAGGSAMPENAAPAIASDDAAVLVLAEAVCDAQLVIAECFEQDLPDTARTLYKLRTILEDQTVIEALKATGYRQD